MIVIIDNYDSFVHNLARYFLRMGCDIHVVRNDAITICDIKAFRPEALVLSPGPCTPDEAGICVGAVRELGPQLPILGVCLGHQAIGQAYGAGIMRSSPSHGKASMIRHNAQGLFAGLPTPMEVGRYHSLAVCEYEGSDLAVIAENKEGLAMAIQHKDYPVYGVQFHPESILTPQGPDLLRNFMDLAAAFHSEKKAAA